MPRHCQGTTLAGLSAGKYFVPEDSTLLASSAPSLDKMKQSLNLQKVISLSHPLVLITFDHKVL